MIKKPIYYLFVCFFHLLLVCQVQGGETTTNYPHSDWSQTGKEWRIRVKHYSRSAFMSYGDPRLKAEARIPRIDDDFEMVITVLKPREKSGQKIGCLQFTPAKGAPEYLKGHVYILEIDLKTGRVNNLVRSDDPIRHGSLEIYEKGLQKVLLTDLLGFPVDWIIQPADLLMIPKGKEEHIAQIGNVKARLKKTLEPAIVPSNQIRDKNNKQAAVLIELVREDYPDIGRGKMRVVQTWVPGESWWRSFQRYHDTTFDMLDVEAFLIDSPVSDLPRESPATDPMAKPVSDRVKEGPLEDIPKIKDKKTSYVLVTVGVLFSFILVVVLWRIRYSSSRK